MRIKCPKCGKETEFTISDAVDDNGEVFRCKDCGYYFRYKLKWYFKLNN